jgi:hypothetical protein
MIVVVVLAPIIWHMWIYTGTFSSSLYPFCFFSPSTIYLSFCFVFTPLLTAFPLLFLMQLPIVFLYIYFLMPPIFRVSFFAPYFWHLFLHPIFGAYFCALFLRPIFASDFSLPIFRNFFFPSFLSNYNFCKIFQANIKIGGGNANFYYAVTLVFTLAQVLLISDAAGAVVKRDYLLKHNITLSPSGEVLSRGN